MRLLSDDRFLGLWSLWPSILSRCPALGRPIWSKGRGRMVNCVPRLKALRMQTLITTGVFSLNSLSMLMSFLRVSTLMDEKDLFAEMPGKSEFNLFSFCQLFRSIPWISPQFFHPPPCRADQLGEETFFHAWSKTHRKCSCPWIWTFPGLGMSFLEGSWDRDFSSMRRLSLSSKPMACIVRVGHILFDHCFFFVSKA